MTGDSFVVAVNDRGQHALWPASLDMAAGWRRESAAMSRQACLDAIAAAWQDIAPAGVRAAPSAEGHPHRFVHERFAEQAARRPAAAAVIAAGARVTYRELDQSANRLARYLKDMGAGPGTLIGVYAERGVEAIRSLLAIMKAGGGYLPLDPSLPPRLPSRTVRTKKGPRRGRRSSPSASSPPASPAGRPPPSSPAWTRTTCATPSTPRGPPAPPRPSPSATAPWPASSPNWSASTGSPPATGWCNWPPSPSTPRSSRYSSRWRPGPA